MRYAILALASGLALGSTTAAFAQDQFREEKPIRFTQQSDVGELASWLALGNRAEIELAKVAIENSQNLDVKDFAQQLIDDHEAYLGKLDKFTGGSTASSDTPLSQPADPARKPTTPRAPMLRIAEEAGRWNVVLTKGMLAELKGQDFDMGFLSQQVVAHTMMLAHLQAMKDHGSSEFKQVVAEGLKTTEEHLREAQELSRKYQAREPGVVGSVEEENEKKKEGTAKPAKPAKP